MLIFRGVAAVALAAAVLLTSVGCSTLEKVRSGMSSASSMATENIAQWTPEKLSEAFAAINAKIGADPADYEVVIVNGLFVSVEAIDPNKRANVDKYQYQGGSVEVGPVDASQNEPGAIEMGAFKGDTVKPEVLGKVMNSAPQESGVENATIDFVMIRKMWANDDEPQIVVYVRGPRGSKNLQYDLTGRLQKVS
jgi:hypothetical protein